jgi:hypothetical protein
VLLLLHPAPPSVVGGAQIAVLGVGMDLGCWRRVVEGQFCASVLKLLLAATAAIVLVVCWCVIAGRGEQQGHGRCDREE